LTFTYYTPQAPPATATSASKRSTVAASSSPIIILDPTTLEETLSEGNISIALTRHGELCVVHKAGGIPLTTEEIMHVTTMGLERVKELDDWLEAQLKEDWKSRSIEVR
jgi:exosome complex component RRP45